jgi:Holliday junction DNA helicase RuvA
VIAFVRGVVRQVSVDSAVVDVGGVGISVQCAPATLAGLDEGQNAELPTSLVVREDSLSLFGFAGTDERSCFELLLTASGVGPKLAQAMLAVHSPDGLRRAVATEDLVALMRVPGIGKKGAQRIVLELKDRIGPPLGQASSEPSAQAPQPSANDAWKAQVHAGLLNLGWSAREADGAVAAVADLAPEQQTPDDPVDVASLLRAALRSLSRA